jgi:hypothetical protein
MGRDTPRTWSYQLPWEPTCSTACGPQERPYVLFDHANTHTDSLSASGMPSRQSVLSR